MKIQVKTKSLKAHLVAASKVNQGTLIPVLKFFCIRSINKEVWLLSTDGDHTYGGVLGQCENSFSGVLVDADSLVRAVRSINDEVIEMTLDNEHLVIAGNNTFRFQVKSDEDFPEPDLECNVNTSNYINPVLQHMLGPAANLVGEKYPFVSVFTKEGAQLLEVLNINSCYRKICSPKEENIQEGVVRFPGSLLRTLSLNKEDDLSAEDGKAFGGHYCATWKKFEDTYPNTDGLFQVKTENALTLPRKALIQALQEASAVNQIFVTLKDKCLTAVSDIVDFKSDLVFEGDFPEKAVSFKTETLLPFLSSWVESDSVQIFFETHKLIVQSENAEEIACVSQYAA